MAEAVMAEDYNGFLAHLADFQSLGGTSSPEMIYYEAVARDRQGDLNAANRAIQAFISRAGSNHRLFGDALVLAGGLASKLAAAGNRHTELEQIVSMPAKSRVNALYGFARRNWSTEESFTASDHLRKIEEPLINRTPAVHRALATGLKWNRQTGHLAISPDGTRVAVLDRSNNVYIRFIDSGQAQWQWTTPGGPGRATIAFSPDPNVFAIGMGDSSIQLWDLRTGRRTSAFGQPERVQGGAFSAVVSMSFSGDGSRLAAILSNGTVLVHDVKAGRELWRFTYQQFERAEDVALSPDGRRLITVSMYHAMVWDVERRSVLFEQPRAEGSYSGAAWSPDGRYFAIADSNAAHIREAARGSIVRTAIGHEADPGRSRSQWAVNPMILQAGFSRSGRFFTLGSKKTVIANTETRDASVYVYEPDGRLVTILTGHGDNGCAAYQQWVCRQINGAVISPDGKNIITTGYDDFMRIWQLP